jgi:hypothetical protein
MIDNELRGIMNGVGGGKDCHVKFKEMYQRHGGPTSIRGQVICDLWLTKWHWGGISPGTSVSLANSQSTNCASIISHDKMKYI